MRDFQYLSAGKVFSYRPAHDCCLIIFVLTFIIVRDLTLHTDFLLW